jgi:gamma-glutamyl:cysteine ligase YbdK (ATP-grasp superfamily)
VHVGVPDAETCLRAFEGVVPWLPTLLALSANSPFVNGEDSGLRSSRAGRLSQLPRGGPPPILGSWREWELATGRDYTRWHWDVRELLGSRPEAERQLELGLLAAVRDLAARSAPQI